MKKKRRSDTIIASRERLLRLLVDHPAAVGDLAKRAAMSKATAYRAAAELRTLGMIEGDADGLQDLTEAGRSWLRLRDATAELEPELPIAALVHVPTPARRAWVGLGL